MRRTLFLFVLCGFLMSTGVARAADGMNAVAERYAHLVLAVGQHDPDYVGAMVEASAAVLETSAAPSRACGIGQTDSRRIRRTDRAQEKLTVDYPDSRIGAVNTIR